MKHVTALHHLQALDKLPELLRFPVNFRVQHGEIYKHEDSHSHRRRINTEEVVAAGWGDALTIWQQGSFEETFLAEHPFWEGVVV